MKTVLQKIAISIYFSIGSLTASVEGLLLDYSEVAIAHVGANKSILKLIVISGNKFSIGHLKNDVLGRGITHPHTSNKEKTFLLLDGAKRAGISSKRALRFKNEIVEFEDYGELRLTDLLKLQIRSECAGSGKPPG